MTNSNTADDQLAARDVVWQGIHNARDLGGLPAGDGMTSFSRFYRAPRLESLTAQGWTELVAAGVRTVIDLRNPSELSASVAAGAAGRPSEVVTWFLPIEDQSDVEFMARWGKQLGSPIYYADNLERWPDKLIAVFRAMVDAPAGGIVFHCSGGRDRTAWWRRSCSHWPEWHQP